MGSGWGESGRLGFGLLLSAGLNSSSIFLHLSFSICQVRARRRQVHFRELRNGEGLCTGSPEKLPMEPCVPVME